MLVATTELLTRAEIADLVAAKCAQLGISVEDAVAAYYRDDEDDFGRLARVYSLLSLLKEDDELLVRP